MASAKRESRDRAHALVKQTGNDYAYEFVQTRRGLVEVRAHKDGTTTYTPVDAQGTPTGTARKPLTEHVRAHADALVVALVALVALVAERVL